MSGAPTFDTGKKQKRGEFITPPRPTGRRSNYDAIWRNLTSFLWQRLKVVTASQAQYWARGCFHTPLDFFKDIFNFCSKFSHLSIRMIFMDFIWTFTFYSKMYKLCTYQCKPRGGGGRPGLWRGFDHKTRPFHCSILFPGGAAPILASVIGVSPKTWRISASADARSTPSGTFGYR